MPLKGEVPARRTKRVPAARRSQPCLSPGARPADPHERRAAAPDWIRDPDSARRGSAACSISANASRRVGRKRSPAHHDRRYRNATHSAVGPPAAGRLHCSDDAQVEPREVDVGRRAIASVGHLTTGSPRLQQRPCASRTGHRTRLASGISEKPLLLSPTSATLGKPKAKSWRELWIRTNSETGLGARFCSHRRSMCGVLLANCGCAGADGGGPALRLSRVPASVLVQGEVWSPLVRWRGRSDGTPGRDAGRGARRGSGDRLATHTR